MPDNGLMEYLVTMHYEEGFTAVSYTHLTLPTN